MRKIKIFTIIIVLTTMMIVLPIKETKAIQGFSGTTGVSIMENGENISNNDGKLTLLKSINNEKIQPGKKYPYKLAIKNSGSTNEFVRVIITKSIISNGDKNVSPTLVKLGFDNGNNWITDTKSATSESVTMYCKKMLKANETTANVINYFMLNNEILKLINEETITDENGYKNINISYQFDNTVIELNVVVEAVQAVNATSAIESTWEVEVELNNDETEIISIK